MTYLIECFGRYYELPDPNEELNPEEDYWLTEEIDFFTTFEDNRD